MFRCLRDSKLLQIISNQTLKKSLALQNPFLKSHSQAHPPSSFLQFLQDSCGLSPEKALQVSQNCKRKPRNADSVLKVLKSNGFSDTHIKSVITVFPKLLSCNAESKLRPKIQFFKDRGVSVHDIVELIVSKPSILLYSLERSIKPLFNFFLSHLGTNACVLRSIRRTKLQMNLPGKFIPNLEALKGCGVPDSRITRLIRSHPGVLTIKADRFDDRVKMTLQMGFNPLSHTFVEAIRVMSCLSRQVWEMKLKLFRSFGWSDEEIMLAFRGHPGCITASNEKIRKGMDFFVNKLGWSPSYISSSPELVSLSLEKRILPRQKLLEALAEKGLIAKDKMFHKRSYVLSKKKFLEKYVMNFVVKFPEILKLYEGIMGLDIKEKR